MNARPSWRQDLVWRIEAGGVAVASALVRLAPVDWVSASGAAILRLIGPLTPVHRVAEQNIRLAFPEMDVEARKRLLSEQWANAGRTFVEFPITDRLTPASGRVEIEGRERLEALARDHTATVLVSGHFANWEIMAVAFTALGVDALVTYRAANNPYIDRMITRGRARYGVKLFAPKGAEGSRDLITAMEAGRAVAFLNDQKFNGGVAAPFFGHTVHTAEGPTRLALRFDAPILPMSVQRTGGARFKVVVDEPIVVQPTGDRRADLEAGVRAINAYIEGKVRERPAEWFWLHRRWPSTAYARPERVKPNAPGAAAPPPAARSARTPALGRRVGWRLEAALMATVRLLMRSLPVDAVSALGAVIGRVFGPLTPLHRLARRNTLLAFPDMPEAERRRLLRDQWDNVGRTFLEFFIADRLTAASGRVEIERRGEAKPEGEVAPAMILVAGHFANWEVMAVVAAEAGLKMVVSYRAANNPYVDKMIVESRARYGIRLFAPKGLDGSRELMASLAEGVSVVIMSDQKYNNGVAAPFFGRTVQTGPGAPWLALRFEAPIIPVSVQRTRGARFRLIIHPPIPIARTGDRRRDLQAGVEAINAWVESCVRERPADWFWIHKRWPETAYQELNEPTSD